MARMSLRRALEYVLSEDTPMRLSRGLAMRWTNDRETVFKGTLSLSRTEVYPSEEEVRIVLITLKDNFGRHEVGEPERSEQGRHRIIRLPITWLKEEENG